MTYPFLSDDTIAAISTPPGPGAIGMVRITGPQAHAVGSRIFTPAGRKKGGFTPRRATFGKAHPPGEPDRPIDLAILCYFAGPDTYTGEDTVEITTHGGVLIMRALLEAAVAGGARLAEPGEFTRRAFTNGRMDLAQAEAVASLIFASSEEARGVMLRQVEGAMGREAREMRDCLLEIRVNLEASIDFPEDVGEPDRDLLLELAGKVHDIAGKLRGTAGRGIALGEGARVVITGAPNVGKSCLLNALIRENRAIVHEIAGTTRDYVEGSFNVDGILIRVVDTAGIRYASDPVEGKGIEKAHEQIKLADLVVLVLDSTREVQPDEKRLLAETRNARRVLVANKSDLESSPAFTRPKGALRISALRGGGMEELRRAIFDMCVGSGSGIDLERGVVTTVRQADALERVETGCARIRTALEGGISPELVAVEVEEAMAGLAELTGEVTTEEVLGEIFSRFCIGK